MSECYLCGSYIARGQGCRRTVETGSSIRLYATRRGGASFGVSSGTRTVCMQCARLLDRTADGAFGRGVLYFVCWLISAYLGWIVLASGQGAMRAVIGLSFLFGLPVLAIGALVESQRRSEIAKEIFADQDVPADFDDNALRPGETAEQWLDRIIPLQVGADMKVWKAYAEYHPPEVGQSVVNWVMSWPEWRDEWGATRADDAEQFGSGDTILTWADRVANSFSKKGASDCETVRASLIGLAKIAKPLIGEDAHQYIKRAQARVAAIDQTLDPTSLASTIREGESCSDWISRYAPLCLVVEEGESLDDVIPKVIQIAEFNPPSRGESALAWLSRVKPRIDEMNAQS